MRKKTRCVICGGAILLIFIGYLCYLELSGWKGGYENEEQILLGESVGLMTKREALDVLFIYLYGEGRNLETVTFFEENVIGYKWSSVAGNVTSYLCEVEVSGDGKYYIFELFHELFDSNGQFIRTQWINEYVVDLQSGEVIPLQFELEDGTWELNPEYIKVGN